MTSATSAVATPALRVLVPVVVALACWLGPAAASGAAPPSCASSGLVVWLQPKSEGAAGSVYTSIGFTNESSRTCTLTGYPGISGVDLHGHTLGTPASRTPAAVRTVTLAPGVTASAQLRIAQAVNFPESACRRVRAAGVRVYPPNQTRAKIVPIPFDACSRRGPVYLNVGPVTAR